MAPLFAAALLGAAGALLPACSEDRGGAEEALEELRDEAMETKEEIEDEIDDRT